MRLLIASDLHLEFHPASVGGGDHLLRILSSSFHSNSCDVAVVAGDLCDYRLLIPSLRRLSAAFPEVVYVLGNHECYGGSIKRALGRARRECAKLGNVHLLEDSVAEIRGRRFVGSTLWFPYPPLGGTRLDGSMNDFSEITRFRPTVGDVNLASRAFLNREVREGDVVVTHHIPTDDAVHPRWAGNALNRYFVGGVDPSVLDRGAALWVHGHTHDSSDSVVGSTRVVCNPLGYLLTSRGPDVNPLFDSAKFADV